MTHLRHDETLETGDQMSEGKKVEFTAVFPHRAGAIDFHGEEGTRIILDVSEQFKPQMLTLPAYFLNKPLRVTIEVDE